MTWRIISSKEYITDAKVCRKIAAGKRGHFMSPCLCMEWVRFNTWANEELGLSIELRDGEKP